MGTIEKTPAPLIDSSTAGDPPHHTAPAQRTIGELAFLK